MTKLIKAITKNSLSLLTCTSIIVFCASAKGQMPDFGCYMIDEYGETVDLSSLCNFDNKNNSPLSQKASNRNQNSPPPSSPEDSSLTKESRDNNPENQTDSKNTQSDSEANNNDTVNPQQQTNEEEDRSKLPIIRKTIPLIDKQRQLIEESQK